MGGAGVTISAHALVRYMERVLGMPMDERRRAVSPGFPCSDAELLRTIRQQDAGLVDRVRREMREAVRPFLDAGAISAKIGDFIVVLNPKARKVVTVLDRNMRKRGRVGRPKGSGRSGYLRTLSRLGRCAEA